MRVCMCVNILYVNILYTHINLVYFKGSISNLWRISRLFNRLFQQIYNSLNAISSKVPRHTQPGNPAAWPSHVTSSSVVFLLHCCLLFLEGKIQEEGALPVSFTATFPAPRTLLSTWQGGAKNLFNERMDDEMPHHTVLNEVRIQPHIYTINSRQLKNPNLK